MKRIFTLLVLGTLFALAASPAQADQEIHQAIDYYGLPPIFHYITERESGSGADLYNDYSGACGYFQFMPFVAAAMGTNCYALSDPYVAAREARQLYDYYRSLGYSGLEPWGF